MITKQNLLEVLAKPGNWPVPKSRKPNRNRKNIMTYTRKKPEVQQGGRVFVYMPSEKKKKGRCTNLPVHFMAPIV